MFLNKYFKNTGAYISEVERCYFAKLFGILFFCEDKDTFKFSYLH